MALNQWNEEQERESPAFRQDVGLEQLDEEDRGPSLSPAQLGPLLGLGVFYLALVVLVLDVLRL